MFGMDVRRKILLSVFTTLALGLSVCVPPSNAVTPVREVYGTAADGTVLHWVAYTPDTAGPVAGGPCDSRRGFHSGSPIAAGWVICAQDLADAGYIAFSIEYRLAPPGAFLARF